MNVLQLIGTIIYAVSLAAIMAGTISRKKGKTVELVAGLASGIILGSADGELNLKIAAALTIFAALLIGVPFIQIKKKGEQ